MYDSLGHAPLRTAHWHADVLGGAQDVDGGRRGAHSPLEEFCVKGTPVTSAHLMQGWACHLRMPLHERLPSQHKQQAYVQASPRPNAHGLPSSLLGCRRQLIGTLLRRQYAQVGGGMPDSELHSATSVY